jgi:glycine cleavage system protein P-like pyridoxal-binding family
MIGRTLVLIYFGLAALGQTVVLVYCLAHGMWGYALVSAGTLLLAVYILAWLSDRWELTAPQPLRLAIEFVISQKMVVFVVGGATAIAMVIMNDRAPPVVRAPTIIAVVAALIIAVVVERRHDRRDHRPEQ